LRRPGRFRKEKGTMDAVGMLRIMSDRTSDMDEKLLLLHGRAEGI
jgi:hypothetical protein